MNLNPEEKAVYLLKRDIFEKLDRFYQAWFLVQVSEGRVMIVDP